MAPAGKSIGANAVPQHQERITGRSNQWLKRFRSALGGDTSREEVVAVEGPRLVEAALESGLRVEALLVSDSGERHLAALAGHVRPETRVLLTTDRLFAGVSDTKTPQGVAALVHPRLTTMDELLSGLPLVVVLVAIQDPGNAGTILRAAEAFGATGAACCAAGKIGTVNPLSPKALRASAGSALRLPILRGMSSTIVLAQLRVAGVKVYASVPHPSGARERSGRLSGMAPGLPAVLRPWEANWNAPAALLIGNEGAGLPEEISAAADARISIPQKEARGTAGVESLNAAMAASIILYEAMRQRDAKQQGRKPS